MSGAQSSWQCHVCGTVYAWWVSRCRTKHEVSRTVTGGEAAAIYRQRLAELTADEGDPGKQT